MAYVAISAGLIDQVESNINSMCGSERKATFGEANEYAWPQMELSHDDPLFEYMWKEAPQLRGLIPKAWLAQVRHVDIHVKGGGFGVANRYTIKDGGMYVPTKHASYAPDINVPDSDTRFDAVRTRVHAVAEVNKRWNGIKNQVIGFLKECRSLNEAVKLYPDIIHYIPSTFVYKLNEQKVKAARDVSSAAAKLTELDTAALSAAPVLARITGHK